VDQAAGRFAKYGPFGHQEVFFPAKEYARRLEAVRARMAEADVDVLITFSPSNITYLCGHFSTNLHDFQCLVVAQTRAPLMVLWYFELARFHASAVGATARPSALVSMRARPPFHRGSFAGSLRRCRKAARAW
jgi:Xaa-Pro aminopeptidase